MKNVVSRLSIVLGLAAIVATGAACEREDLTEASIANEFPARDPNAYTVIKVWYASTLFLDPIAPGEVSETLRVKTGSEPVYAILARASSGVGASADAGADADGGAMELVAARTRDAVTLSPHETRRVVLSPMTMQIGCGGPDGMSPSDYAIVATRIFPGDPIARFAAGTCTPAAATGAP